MSSFWIIPQGQPLESVDVFEQSNMCLFSCVPDVPPYHLGLNRFPKGRLRTEECFDDCVVQEAGYALIAITFVAHRYFKAMFFEQFLVIV